MQSFYRRENCEQPNGVDDASFVKVKNIPIEMITNAGFRDNEG